MASRKAVATLFLVVLVVVDAGRAAQALTCFEDCMRICVPVRFASWDGCANQCSKACISIGRPGMPRHHRRPPHCKAPCSPRSRLRRPHHRAHPQVPGAGPSAKMGDQTI
ncbi:hypothetical protein Taro_041267 [Colocasia esculenta]|uniref:Uncharacterized protein n=1 Tax=Colocasia esculenta TaxID=4460 RepID=A0A843WSZ0_COLES|nr:hypothetical protein [Colocasia esculenta]